LQANRRLEVALAENAGLQRQLLTQACEAGVLDERQRRARELLARARARPSRERVHVPLDGTATLVLATGHATLEPEAVVVAPLSGAALKIGSDR
jgi:hypothetical protein